MTTAELTAPRGSLLSSNERQIRIKSICSQRFFRNFEDELAFHREEFKDVDLLQILFPSHYSLLNYWLKGRVLSWAIFFTIWNVLGYILVMVFCAPSYSSQLLTMVFYALEVIFPLLLLFIHARFVQTWRGDFSDSESVI